MLYRLTRINTQTHRSRRRLRGTLKGVEVPRQRIYNAGVGKSPIPESENEEISWVLLNVQQDTAALHRKSCGSINQYDQCDAKDTVLTKKMEMSRPHHIFKTWKQHYVSTKFLLHKLVAGKEQYHGENDCSKYGTMQRKI